MVAPIEVEHEELLQASVALTADLRNLQKRLEHGEEVMHIQHVQFADRALQLSLYLDAAVGLCRSNLYPPGFAALRSALEHHVFDWLLFEADRFVQEYPDVDANTWKKWQENRPADVLEWRRLSKNRVRVVWRGVMVDHSYVLSIYYQYLRQYYPLALRPGEAKATVVGHPFSEEDVEEVYRPMKRMWKEALRWEEMKENLRLNELV